jgi:hypothetical protein
MKISAEAEKRNRELINKLQAKWKEEEKKTTLEYFKEIQEVSRESFAIATLANDNMFERGIYKPGQGEVMQPARVGSEDHLKYKSKGLLKDEHKDA